MIEALQQQFGIDGQLQFELGHGDLPRVRITTDACEGEIYLHGAHVTHWQPSGHAPVLWLSRASRFATDQAIRGGIPICWPWFGDHPSDPSKPAHGFARRSAFEIERTFSTGSSCGVVFALSTPEGARLEYTVTMGAELDVALLMTNGSSQRETWTCALHTYLAVSDASNVAISGLADTEYLDKTEGFAQKLQYGEPRIDGEVDRVYLETDREVFVQDPELERTLAVGKTGSRTTVFWNPGPARAQAMSDLDDDGYRTMLCIEAANAAHDVITLDPGEAHVLGTRIRTAER